MSENDIKTYFIGHRHSLALRAGYEKMEAEIFCWSSWWPLSPCEL